MRFEWLIARRYLVPKRSLMVLIITTLSVLGVALGVAALITVLSVMGGFATDLREKIVATKAHVVVSAEHGYLDRSSEILAQVGSDSDVTGAAAYIESEVMISTSSSADGIVLRGIDIETIGQTSNLPDSIVDGQLQWLVTPAAALEELRSWRNNRVRDTTHAVESAAERLEAERADNVPEAVAAEPGEGTGFEMPPVPVEKPVSRDKLEPVPAPAEMSPEGAGSVMPPIPGQGSVMPPIPGQGAHGEGNHVMPDLPYSGARHGGRQSLPGIVIGGELATRLHVGVGSEITIISPDGQLLPTGPAPLSRPYLVVATFFTGMYEFDTRFAYVTMDEARDILRVPDEQVTAVDIKLRELDVARSVAARLDVQLTGAGHSGVLVRSWEDLNKGLFTALKLEKIAIFVILTIIILVASFSIVSNLIIMVIERTSEIAILKSMGTTNGSIMRIFGIQGGMIGVVGTILGVLVGVANCVFIEGGGIPLDTEVYYIEYLPVDLQVGEVVVTALAAIGISLLATVYPALKATRISPAEGLRHD